MSIVYCLPLASYTYTLDPAGHRLSVTEADGSTIAWTYDGAYRLLGEVMQDASSAVTYQAGFSYDPVGNRLSQTVDGTTTDYAYNELDQLLTAGTVQFQYDGRGNLAQVTDGSDVTHYAYDAADRLTGVTLPDGTTIANVYDVDGRRVQQTINAQTTDYLWDETSPYGDVIYETAGAGATSYVLGGAELLSQNRDGTTSYYLRDGQTSVRALADGAGVVTDTYEYSAYGELLSQTGSSTNAYLYTGQQFDAAAGLYSLRARYYDPVLGRFLSRDSAGFGLTNWSELNRYAYASNNPTNGTDPRGTTFLEDTQLRESSVETAEVLQWVVTPLWRRALGEVLARLWLGPLVGCTLLCGGSQPMPQPAPSAPPQEEPAPETQTQPQPRPGTTPAPPMPPTPTPEALVLIHYGTEAKIAHILVSQLIPPSLEAENPSRARYGNGVYFTDILPGSMSKARIARALYGSPFASFQLSVQAWIAVDVAGLPLQRSRQSVYRFPTVLPLSVEGRIRASGLTP